MPVHAPYAFVPLSRWIHTPSWGELVSHDVPFTDGVSGSFEIEITNLTPLTVGGPRRKPLPQPNARKGEVRPFQLADGAYALPAAGLQGCIRNILEIAAFGRMRFVDDKRRFGLRDLTRSAQPFYQERLSPFAGGVAASQVSAGWLQRVDGALKLHPCEWAKIEVFRRGPMAHPKGGNHVPVSIQALFGAAQFTAADWREKRNLASATGAPPSRYDLFPAGFSLARTFAVDGTSQDYSHPRPNNPNFRIRQKRAWETPAPAGAAAQKGHIVLTGVPGGNKHMEFFFYATGSKAVRQGPDLDEAFQLFEELHEPDDGRPSNANWLFYRDQGYPQVDPFGVRASFAQGGAMPVFYLEEAGEIVGLGLASMFKLPHRLRVRDLIANTNPKHVPPEEGETDSGGYDFATLLFGDVLGEDGRGLKRRVSFDFARAQGEVQTMSPKPVLLSSPKPSYHPSYVRQPGAAPFAKQTDQVNGRNLPYASYTPLQGRTPLHAAPEIAGYKVYPAEANTKRADLASRAATQPDDMDPPGPQMYVDVHAISPGAVFRTTARFHNLRPAELGALVWALTLGDPKALAGGWSCRNHRLGLGKPLGMGEVKVRVVSETAAMFANGEDSPALETALHAFEQHMEQAFASAPGKAGVATWSTSEQIRTLQAAADPNFGSDKHHRPYELKYMSAKAHSDAKGGFWFLPRYLPQTQPPVIEMATFPRPTPRAPAEGPPPGAPPSSYPEKRDPTGEVGRVIAKGKPGTLVLEYANGERDEWPEAELSDV